MLIPNRTRISLELEGELGLSEELRSRMLSLSSDFAEIRVNVLLLLKCMFRFRSVSIIMSMRNKQDHCATAREHRAHSAQRNGRITSP